MTTIVPVLLYHRISDIPRDPFAVPPRRFLEHVETIRASGRTPLTISEVADGLRGAAPLPERPVAITFDDGFVDTVNATDALGEVGLPATVYVTTGVIGTGDSIPADHVALLAERAGIELGAHTVSHPHLDELSLDAARREIFDSKVALEDLVGRTIETFAYPYGAYDTRSRRLVIDAGFTSAAAVKNAISHPADDPWAVARWTVRSDTSAQQIAELLDGRLAPLAWSGDRLRTRVYRPVRRLRRRLSAWPVVNDCTVTGGAGASASPHVGAADTPIAVRTVDVSGGPTTVTVGSPRFAQNYNKLAVLVRVGARPLGWVVLEVPFSGTVSASELAQALSDQLPGSAAEDECLRHVAGAQGVNDGELLSLVVTTCADSEAVVRCVKAVLDGATGQVEVIVVENRPSGSRVQSALEREFGDRSQVKYVEEPRRGLSYARNAGLRLARGRRVAFTDDDVVVDQHWVSALRNAFARNPEAQCISGPILPLELETMAQVLVEQFAAFSKGLERQEYSLATEHAQGPLFPYAAGHFGSGANMAFDTHALRALGGFDVALGAGTYARGGEDLDVSLRLIRSGAKIVYEPNAIVWHRHPDERSRVRGMALSYGVGLGAMLGKQLLLGPDRFDLLSLVPTGLRYLLSRKSRKNSAKRQGFPRTLNLLERVGLAIGPAAYMLSRAERTGGRRDAVVPTQAGSPVRRVWSGELELAQPSVPDGPLVTARGERFDHARLLVRRNGEPVGFVQVPLDDGSLDLHAALAAVDSELSTSLDALPAARGVSAAASESLVTVVLCTRNRPDGVRRLFASLTRLRHQHLEVIVVDNAPDDEATKTLIAELASNDPRVRYVRESRPGLSRARNAGLREARGEYIAFTDDDVRVDADWVQGILRGFARRMDVGCVTGLVASASLERPVERFFDERVWWSSSCEHRLYDASTAGGSTLYPYAAGIFGTGANMAFRTDVLRSVGGFDESLGTGSPTRGGEDLDIFVRLLCKGYALSYEPGALVWHDHRIDFANLESQMYGYGKGLAAYVCKYLFSRACGPDIAARVLQGAWRIVVLRRRSRAASRSSGVGKSLQRAELRGMMAGGPAYLKVRRGQDPLRLKAVRPVPRAEALRKPSQTRLPEVAS